MRRTSPLLLALLAVALVATESEAATTPKYKTAVGIGDESPSMFTNASFKALKVKRVRYFIAWDAIRHSDELAKADAYVAAARKAKTTVLMHISTNDLRHQIAKLPSAASYRIDVGKLIKRYRAQGVTDWGAWNEANHQSEPTWKHPATAARFFLAMRDLCKGCKIVALDVIDQPGATNYIKRWFTALGKKNRAKATIIGLHNYYDINNARSTGTSAILKTVKTYNRKATFWLTETGGVYGFGGKVPCNATRQAQAIGYMFTLTKKYQADIKRLYSYNFFGITKEQCQEGLFDAGIVNARGQPRPAYAVFRAQAQAFAR